MRQTPEQMQAEVAKLDELIEYLQARKHELLQKIARRRT